MFRRKRVAPAPFCEKKAVRFSHRLFFLSQGIYIVNMKGSRLLLFSLLIAVIVPTGLFGLELEYQGLDWEVGFLWKHNEGYDTEEGDSGPDLLQLSPVSRPILQLTSTGFLNPASSSIPKRFSICLTGIIQYQLIRPTSIQ